jgi:Zn-dependent protease with chaperone function
MRVRRFVLYSVTMFVELISVSVRFAFVSAVAMLFVRREVAVALGALAALGPVIAALVVLAGVPSGHRFVRRSLGARPLTPDEQRRLERAVQPIRAQGITLPRRIFTVPERGLNAAVSGRTLYIFQDLYASPYLAGIVAHELGHYHSLDGRMLLALRSLTIPGGFLFVYLMLQMLRGLAYIVTLLLSAVLFVIFALFRLRLAAAVAAVFHIVLTLLRLLIIFAVGGVGPALLGSFWRDHFIEREYAADAYAVRLGYGADLIAFFERHVLTDVSIPWYEQPTHPPSRRRIANLRSVMAGAAPPLPAQAAAPAYADEAAPALDTALPAPSWNAIARAPRPARMGATVPMLTAAIVTLLVLGAALLFNLQTGAATPMIVPTIGPTPTLGVPGL